MDLSDLTKSGLGAVIGFFLAQAVNLARIVVDWYLRPRLYIDADPNCLVLMHSVEQSSGEILREQVYAFRVCNRGRTIASGVKVQLVKIETLDEGSDDFRIQSHDIFALSPLANLTTSVESLA